MQQFPDRDRSPKERAERASQKESPAEGSTSTQTEIAILVNTLSRLNPGTSEGDGGSPRNRDRQGEDELDYRDNETKVEDPPARRCVSSGSGGLLSVSRNKPSQADDSGSEGTLVGDIEDSLDTQRWDMIDRIMKSFCSALDSKLTKVKHPEPPITVEKEPEPEDGPGTISIKKKHRGPRLAAQLAPRKGYTGDQVAWAQPARASISPQAMSSVHAAAPAPALASLAVQTQLQHPSPAVFAPGPNIPPPPPGGLARRFSPRLQSSGVPSPPPPRPQIPRPVLGPRAPGPASGSPIIPNPSPSLSSSFGQRQASQETLSPFRSFARVLTGRRQSTSPNELQESATLDGALNARQGSTVDANARHRERDRRLPAHRSSTHQYVASNLRPILPGTDSSTSPQDSALPLLHYGTTEQFLGLGAQEGLQYDLDASYSTLGMPPARDISPGSSPLLPDPIIHQVSAHAQSRGGGDPGVYQHLAVAFDLNESIVGVETSMSAPTADLQPERSPEEADHLQTKRRIGPGDRQEGKATSTAPDDGDGDGRRKRAKKLSAAPKVEGLKGEKKFACPYYKRNPKKYRTWTSCPGPGWEEVHRVKTHLYRRHQLPIQCPRCWQPFKADSELQLHLQQDLPCTIQANRMLNEGFSKDQEKRLRSRKKVQADMTDEDKWSEIYRILFPDDDETAIPSPYYGELDSEGEASAQDGLGDLEDYATFIRREMPTLVRRELESLFSDEFQDVDERVRPRVAEIVLKLQPRLLSLYKQSQMPLTEYGPEQHVSIANTSELSPPGFPSQATGSGASTGSDSTPAAIYNTDGFWPIGGMQIAQLCSYNDTLDTNWDTLYPGENQVQPHIPDTAAGLGLDWDFEFDKLLDPRVFMPLPAAYPGLESAQTHLQEP